MPEDYTELRKRIREAVAVLVNEHKKPKSIVLFYISQLIEYPVIAPSDIKDCDCQRVFNTLQNWASALSSGQENYML